MSFVTPPPYTGFSGTTTSEDGTTIVFDRSGDGPPIILMDGVTSHRAHGPSRRLAELMVARGFTAFTYDRRGRGDSTEATPYAGLREVEDLAAVIEEAGGSAHVFGTASAVIVALDAANSGVGIRSLAMFDPPFVVDHSRRPLPGGFEAHLNELIAAGRLSQARALYVGTGMPWLTPFMPLLRLMPSWKRSLEFVPYLSHDVALSAEFQTGRPLPTGRWANVDAPTLVATSARSPRWLRHASRALVGVLQDAQLDLVKNQGRRVTQEALAPILAGFFARHDSTG